MMVLPVCYGGNTGETDGVDLTTTLRVSVTAGTNPAKGAYAQLVASTAQDARGIIVTPQAAGGLRSLFDIAVGGAGSEVVIIPNIATGEGTGYQSVFFPIAIPAGSRLSCAVSCSTSASAGHMSVTLVYAGGSTSPVYQRATAYGVDTANVRGTLATAPATANTKTGAAYAQLTASTTNPIKSLYVWLTPGSSGTSSYAVDIAVGAAAAEVVVVPNVVGKVNSATLSQASLFGPFAVSIPAGTRISARCQASVLSTNIGVIVLGLD